MAYRMARNPEAASPSRTRICLGSPACFSARAATSEHFGPAFFRTFGFSTPRSISSRRSFTNCRSTAIEMSLFTTCAMRGGVIRCTRSLTLSRPGAGSFRYNGAPVPDCRTRPGLFAARSKPCPPSRRYTPPACRIYKGSIAELANADHLTAQGLHAQIKGPKQLSNAAWRAAVVRYIHLGTAAASSRGCSLAATVASAGGEVSVAFPSGSVLTASEASAPSMHERSRRHACSPAASKLLSGRLFRSSRRASVFAPSQRKN